MEANGDSWFRGGFFLPKIRVAIAAGSGVILSALLGGDMLARNYGFESYLAPTIDALCEMLGLGAVYGVFAALYVRSTLTHQHAGVSTVSRRARINYLEVGWLVSVILAQLALLAWSFFLDVALVVPLAAGMAVAFSANNQRVADYQAELRV